MALLGEATVMWRGSRAGTIRLASAGAPVASAAGGPAPPGPLGTLAGAQASAATLARTTTHGTLSSRGADTNLMRSPRFAATPALATGYADNSGAGVLAQMISPRACYNPALP